MKDELTGLKNTKQIQKKIYDLKTNIVKKTKPEKAVRLITSGTTQKANQHHAAVKKENWIELFEDQNNKKSLNKRQKNSLHSPTLQVQVFTKLSCQETRRNTPSIRTTYHTFIPNNRMTDELKSLKRIY